MRSLKMPVKDKDQDKTIFITSTTAKPSPNKIQIKNTNYSLKINNQIKMIIHLVIRRKVAEESTNFLKNQRMDPIIISHKLLVQKIDISLGLR